MNFKEKIGKMDKMQKTMLVVAIPILTLMISYTLYDMFKSDNSASTELFAKDSVSVPVEIDKGKAESLLNKFARRERDLDELEGDYERGNVNGSEFDGFGNGFSSSEDVQQEMVVTEKKETVVSIAPSTYKKVYSTSKPKSIVSSDGKVESIPVGTEDRVRRTGNQFYTSSSNDNRGVDLTNINCVIHGEHNVTNGQKVKLRTTQQAVFGNQIVPENTYLYGIANFSQERVNIVVSSININNNIIRQQFNVYDIDGGEGIYIPGGIDQKIGQDALSNGAGRGINVNIPIIGGSVNTGGLSQKLKDASVNIPSGYKVFIKNK